MSRLAEFMGLRTLGVSDHNRTVAAELVEREDTEELYEKLGTLLDVCDQIKAFAATGGKLVAMPTPIALASVNVLTCKIVEELERREQQGADDDDTDG